MSEPLRLRPRPGWLSSLQRLLATLAVLAGFGAAAVTATFYVVSLTDELAADRLRMSSERPPDPEPFWPRYSRWVKTVVGSGFRDLGHSHTGPVRDVLADRLPVTASIGFLSWLAGWSGGLALAIWLATRGRALAHFHQDRIYPVAHAVPALVVVMIAYVLLIQFDPRPSRLVRAMVGIASLTLILLPSATALWLNGIERVCRREYIRVARARGVSPVRLWVRHILPNVVVSSGVLTQAVFSLAGMVVGSAFVEGVFRLGGVAEAFIEATTHGQAELAGFATLAYFGVTAAGVLLVEGLLIVLDPEREVRLEA